MVKLVAKVVYNLQINKSFPHTPIFLTLVLSVVLIGVMMGSVLLFIHLISANSLQDLNGSQSLSMSSPNLLNVPATLPSSPKPEVAGIDSGNANKLYGPSVSPTPQPTGEPTPTPTPSPSPTPTPEPTPTSTPTPEPTPTPTQGP